MPYFYKSHYDNSYYNNEDVKPYKSQEEKDKESNMSVLKVPASNNNKKVSNTDSINKKSADEKLKRFINFTI